MKRFIGRTARLERRTLQAGGPPALVLIVLLVWGLGVATGQERSKDASPPPGAAAGRATDANDPNELWWRRWDASVQDPNNPEELLSVKWQAVVRVLQSKDLEQKVKERIIDRIVSPTFDFAVMGQLALGRTHWPKLNEAQREKFLRLFAARLKTLYLEKTALYKNERFVLKAGTLKKNTAQVPMTLISDDGETAIVYKLRKLNEAGKSKTVGLWRIYDVEIEGVSILLTYRSQFDDILRRGSVDELLAQLEKPTSK
jgi:phospholipid transport system substrate-binding protein